jgi:hypothetical protein
MDIVTESPAKGFADIGNFAAITVLEGSGLSGSGLATRNGRVTVRLGLWHDELELCFDERLQMKIPSPHKVLRKTLRFNSIVIPHTFRGEGRVKGRSTMTLSIANRFDFRSVSVVPFTIAPNLNSEQPSLNE